MDKSGLKCLKKVEKAYHKYKDQENPPVPIKEMKNLLEDKGVSLDK